MKYKAVNISNPKKVGTGWEVRTKRQGLWYTVCETWCVDGLGDAKETAEKIAALLNQSENNPK